MTNLTEKERQKQMDDMRLFDSIGISDTGGRATCLRVGNCGFALHNQKIFHIDI